MLGETRDEAGELAGMPPERFGEHLRIEVVDDERECFDEGLVGHPELVVAPAVEHGHALHVCAAPELARQTGLPDAGLARDEHEGPLPSAASRQSVNRVSSSG